MYVHVEHAVPRCKSFVLITCNRSSEKDVSNAVELRKKCFNAFQSIHIIVTSGRELDNVRQRAHDPSHYFLRRKERRI